MPDMIAIGCACTGNAPKCRNMSDGIAEFSDSSALKWSRCAGVDERDRRLATPRVPVPVVQRDAAGLGAQLADVDGVLPLRPDDDGQLVDRPLDFQLGGVAHDSSGVS